MTGPVNLSDERSERREHRSWRVRSGQFTLRELGLMIAASAVVVAWYLDQTRLSVELERPRIEEEMLRQEANRLRREIGKLGVSYLGGN